MSAANEGTVLEGTVLKGTVAEGTVAEVVSSSGQEAELVIGTHIVADYYEVSILGKGAFGTVKKSYSRMRPNTLYAVKCLSADTSRKSKMAKEEIKLLEKARGACSKYILCLVEWFEEPSAIYIVTEFLEGFSPLTDHIPHLANNDDQCMRMSSQLCEGLAYLHANGISHRDIKPANIMVNLDAMRVKYIDFGVSCLVKEKIGNGCVPKRVGTPNYMDPLVNFSGSYRNKIDTQNADLWSLGVLLFVIQSGGTPPAQLIRGKSLTVVELGDENDELMNLFEFNNTRPIDQMIDHLKLNSVFTKHKQLYDRAVELGLYYGYIPRLLSISHRAIYVPAAEEVAKEPTKSTEGGGQRIRPRTRLHNHRLTTPRKNTPRTNTPRTNTPRKNTPRKTRKL